MAKIKITNPQQIINGGAKKYYFKVKGLGGPKGDKGDKGDTGATGPQGPQGNTATVSVGSTTTLPVGQDATVENVGSLYNAVLNFGIPQGPRGPQGATGAKGDKGDKGDQGNTGPTGPAGQNATVYIGTTTTLNPGTQATVYNSGTENNAVLNFGIPRGEKGETGATGATGATGPAGQDGQNFTPTIVDSLPATGNQSNLYLTPKNYTTGTATGNPITISLGEEAGQVTSAQLDGDTYQQSYTGKNIYQSIGVSVASGGITSELQPDGKLRLHGKATSNSSNFAGTMTTNLPAGTYTFSMTKAMPFRILLRSGDNQNHWVLEAGQTKITQTISNDLTTLWVWGYQLVAGTDYDETVGFQLEAGSVDEPSFEPYVGGTASPNPDYPQAVNTVTGTQTVDIVGKNLLNPNMLHPVGYSETINGVTYTMMADGGIKMKGTAGSSASSFTFLGVSWSDTTNQIPLDGSKAYMSSITRPNSAYRWYLRGYVNGAIATLNSNQDSLAISNCTGITYAFLQVSANQAVDAVVYPQVELGSTATSFAKYSKQTLPIDLGSIELCKIGTYQDYIYKSGDDWKIHKATGKYTFNGQEAWDYDSNTPRLYLSSSALADIGITPVFPESSSSLPTGVTNKFIAKTFVAFYTNAESNGFAMSTSAQNFQIGSKAWASEQAAKADINGLIWYYALKSTAITDTTITDQTLIAQLEAVRNATLQASNTITNTATGTNLAGDLELGYYEYDPHNRYNKWLWLDINNNYEQLGS